MLKRTSGVDIDVCVSDLKAKTVVNMLDGKQLGGVVDIELDIESGRLTAIVVPGPGRFLGLFGRGGDIVIPWEKISKIGVDCILVESTQFADTKEPGK